jgi:Putative heavy-metal-binding
VSDELPAVARAGEAGACPGGTWGSALTMQEFAAIRGVGFEPVGQVFGAAVYAAGDARGYDCPGTWGSSGATTPAPPATQVSGQGDLGSFGLLVEAMYRARHTAIGRMAAECAALGGHGVVGVRLRRGSFRLGGLEFTAIGTAVRAPGAAHGPGAPFTSGRPGRISPGSSRRAGYRPGWRWASRSGRGTMTGQLPARPARGQATRRWPAGPNWSASRGTMPGERWKVTSGGSAPMAW